MSPLSEKKIYIIGPRRVQNELLAAYLALETGATCQSLVSSQEVEGWGKGNEGHPDLALLDCCGKRGEECLSKLDRDFKQILAEDYLAMFNLVHSSGIEADAVERGVRGFFYLQDSLKQFLKGVLAIFDGEYWIPRKLTSELIMRNRKENCLPSNAHDPLTVREMEILRMVALGCSNCTIAEKLFISPHTVKTHLYSIYRKIKVPSHVQATLWVAKNH